ncbi:NUDIX hydrolase [Ancylobacter sp. Lp-2]|uniref:NUDIX hydrolase n=1 Tax=Ancylobacter sp. Lp-2 TaxID=2881339 RepID=UPI001E5F9377|nr:NUDIX hydrolase [Ancylobacter sp. Lp-2]MCB4770678.1 NUDIX hydrolase [Ancylobacter sp. Lp-2]
MSPVRPVAAVLAVVIRDARLLLVRRANPPDQGRWGYPGGRIEWGEPFRDAALRELMEETGIAADSPELIDVLDFIEADAAGALAHHFAMIAVVCRWRSGEGEAADDALETGWFTLAEVERMGRAASDKVGLIARRALRLPPAD